MRMTGAVCSMQLSAHLHRSASTVIHYIHSYITTCSCSVVVDHGLVMLRSLHILEKVPHQPQAIHIQKRRDIQKSYQWLFSYDVQGFNYWLCVCLC